jgi:hypothetical protein
LLISIEGSQRSFKPKAHKQDLDKARLKRQFRVEDKQKGGKHDFKQGSGFLLVENVGQVIVQDGGSADHGLSGSPPRFLV